MRIRKQTHKCPKGTINVSGSLGREGDYEGVAGQPIRLAPLARGKLRRLSPYGSWLYHGPVHSLAERVLSHIRRQELLRAGDRVGVGVSGGIDSVALLRLLVELRGELGVVLSVVHFNHKLRGAESDADEQFVANLARAHGLEFLVDSDDVAKHAREERVSVETAARELRYGFFRRLLGTEWSFPYPSEAKALNHNESSDRTVRSAAPPKSKDQGLKPLVPEEGELRGAEAPLFHGDAKGRGVGVYPAGAGTSGAEVEIPTSRKSGETWGIPISPHLNKIVTGHTLDDQAETVLMRMIRGAGLRGLGGIYPRIPVEDDEGEICGEIVRPLLTVRRRDLEQYLKDTGQPWREDSTNTDATLTRNRVRKLVVPLLEGEFNPAVVENLADLAEIARGEQDYWENEIAGWMGTTVHWSEPEWARDASSQASLVQIASAGDSGPQGLKPPVPAPSRGPKGPLFHESPSVRGDPQEGSLFHESPSVGGDPQEGPLFHESPSVRGDPQEGPLYHESLSVRGDPQEGPLFHGRHDGAAESRALSKQSSGPSRGKERLAQDDNAVTIRSRIDSAPWLVMNASVSRLWLLGEPVAVQRRVIKAVGEHAGIPLEFKHVEEILRFAAEDAGAGRQLSLPLGWKARRDPAEIVFVTPDLRQPVATQDYEYELPIPGTIRVNETGTQIEALRIPGDAAAEYNPNRLLDAASLRGPLRVRNWRPGDRFWPAHTKSPKKVKELLQERRVAQPERRSWPVAVSGNEIVWVRGFPPPAKLRAAAGREAIWIVERPLAGTPTA